MSLLEQLKEQMKVAMRAKEKQRLSTIRMALAAVKQREIDEQITLDNDAVLAILVKMVKQRRDAAAQYEEANRQDLADVELQEITVIEEFLPKPLTSDEIDALIKDAIAQTGATSMQEMGKVMAILKPQVQGRADLGKISGLIKAAFAG
ncbi:GatB/YqeY domain-containing protein [Psychrobium sp. 1_MG-2023]|uniref:GatB/YqeY domain-containing protein n=1 Tax=Psychrobium sp. 1_MG-2023 TaxID=3062624 RepID=UPI000C31FA60|nr:GatB/YqeY domain-containing protein [Psychrobium sp. 1_MG-2023]MDP2560745.1 GatB/YqeY domain-containing protein [Psychrobium sp. 1_MG-2023]PKF56638.1 glutamyl-tRNA amidotransferase [Alteromonadales bacterium alter-6D02]